MSTRQRAGGDTGGPCSTLRSPNDANYVIDSLQLGTTRTTGVIEKGSKGGRLAAIGIRRIV